MEDFRDKVVVITGGATGIGFSFAKQFGNEGARVVIGGLRENRLQEAVEKLKALGVEAQYCVSDVTKREQVEALSDFAWEAFGRVDVVLNNAGVTQEMNSVIDMSAEDFLRVYDVNVFGVLNGTAVFGRRFIEQRTPAAIYNVGSENCLFNAVPMSAAYVSSKHAVLAITESLREEVPEFIDVGLICPGFVRSELGDPEAMRMAMDTDRFTSIAMAQIKNGEFFIVSHAYNMVRIGARNEAISTAYARYAPRYDGDDEFDVRTLFARMAQESD